MIYDPNMARWPAMVTGHTNDRRPVDIAYAALVEALRVAANARYEAGRSAPPV